MYLNRPAARTPVAALTITIALLVATVGGGPVGTAGANGHSTPIEACGPIDQAGTYHLIGDLNGSGVRGACIEIMASDVVIDGNGFTVAGGGSGIGVRAISEVPRQNVTLRNMSVTGWTTGIHLYGVDGAVVEGVNVNGLAWTSDLPVYGEGTGVYVESSQNVSIAGGEVTGAYYGVVLDTSTENAVEGLTLSGNHRGIELFAAHRNLLRDNTLAGHLEHGIVLGASDDNTLQGNVIATGSQWDVEVAGSKGNAFTDLHLDSALLHLTAEGVRLAAADPVDPPTAAHRALAHVAVEAAGRTGWLNVTAEYDAGEVAPYQEGAVAWWNVTAGEWSQLEGYNVIDAATRQVTTNTTTFGHLGVLVEDDVTPPQSDHALTGEMGSNRWFSSPVEVALGATDDWSGVDATNYRLDGGVWQQYAEPFVVADEGETLLEYQSVDVAGNAGSIRSHTLRVDPVAPNTTATLEGPEGLGGWFSGPVSVSLSASDAGSGVVATTYRVGNATAQPYEAPFTVADAGETVVTFHSVDAAGNVEANRTVTVRIDATPPFTEASVSGETLEGDYVETATVTLTATDEKSGVKSTTYRLDGGPWQEYVEPFTLTVGTTTVEYRSDDAAGNSEAPRSTEVRVVERPPPPEPRFRVTDATVAPTEAEPGENVTIRAIVHNDGDGGGTHNLAVRPGDNTVRFIPVRVPAGGSREVTITHAYAEPGVYAVTVDGAPAGTVNVQAPPVEEPEAPPQNETVDAPVDNRTDPGGGSGGGSGAGGRRGSGGSGGNEDAPVETHQATPVSLRIVPPEGEDGNTTLRVLVENAPDASRIVLVVRDQSGKEMELSRGGSEATWNTSGWDNGVYTVEAREQSDDGGERTVATQSYVLQNPLASPAQATAAVAAGAAIMVAGASAGATAVSRAVNFLDVFTRTLRRRLNVEFRDRTKALLAFLTPGDATSAALAATILAFTATYIRLPAWNPWGFLAALPVFGLAAVLGAVAWLGSDYLMARLTGSESHYRLHGAGAIAVVATTLAFRSPFGIPGYVDKGAPPARDGWTPEGVAAFRGVAHLGALTAFFIPFIAAGRLWSYAFGEAGTLLLTMLLVSSVVPMKPFAGHALWKWNKPAAVAALLAALGVYYVFQLALAPTAFYVGLGVAGAATAAWFVYAFRPSAEAAAA